jgi:hypothetical protein
MPVPAKIKQLLEDMAPYIQQSAMNAADFFADRGVTYQIFEGTKLELTSEMCESLYKDMITEMMRDGIPVYFKFGLMAALVPARRVDDHVLLMLHLGISFPQEDRPHS